MTISLPNIFQFPTSTSSRFFSFYCSCDRCVLSVLFPPMNLQKYFNNPYFNVRQTSGFIIILICYIFHYILLFLSCLSALFSPFPQYHFYKLNFFKAYFIEVILKNTTRILCFLNTCMSKNVFFLLLNDVIARQFILKLPTTFFNSLIWVH